MNKQNMDKKFQKVYFLSLKIGIIGMLIIVFFISGTENMFNTLWLLYLTWFGVTLEEIAFKEQEQDD